MSKILVKMEDLKARVFADDLFLYLFHKIKLIKRRSSTRGSTKGEFKDEMGQSVLYFTYTYHDFCKRYFHSFLEYIMQSKENYIRYLKLYCTSHKCNQNIFDKFLNASSFLLEMVLFCHSEGDDGFIFFAPLCWMEFFECELRNEFYSEGGWRELGNHIQFKGYATSYKTVAKKIESFLNLYGKDERFPTIFKDGSEQEWNDSISDGGNPSIYSRETLSENIEGIKYFVPENETDDSGGAI